MTTHGDANELRQNADELRQQGQDTADKASDKAGQMADQATQRANQQRGRVADTMERGAEQLDQRADQIPGGPRTQDMAHNAADRLESAATYMRQKDVTAMADDLESLVRSHPKESLIGAAAAGFLVAKVLR